MPKHGPAVLSILLCLVSFSTAEATCSANVSASMSGTTLTINASGGGECGPSSISSVFLDNTLIGNQSCAGSSCSFSQTRSTTCLRSGTHTVTASVACGKSVGNSCAADTEGLASATFSVDSQPTVSISYAPDASGTGSVVIHYSFPNTANPDERTLNRAFDKPGGIDIDTIHPTEAEGTWTIPWSVSCYAPGGTYTFRVTATHCSGDEATAQQPVTIPLNKPTVSLSYSYDAMGHGIVSIPYNFPGTSDPSQRTLTRSLQRSGSINIETIHPATPSGTWTFDWNVTCWPTGTYNFEATATHCNGETATDTKAVVVDSTPTVSYTYQDPDELGHGNVVIAYNFPNTDAPEQRRVTRELIRPGSINYESIFAPQPGGTASFPVSVTCTSPGELQVRATAESCTELKSTDAQPLPADHRPTATLALTPESGGYQAVVNYGFPQTDAPSQRQLRLETVPGGSVLATAQATTVRGAWTVNLGCLATDVEKVRAVAVACGDQQVVDEKEIPSAKPAITNVVVEPVLSPAGFKATVWYAVPPEAGTASLRVSVPAEYNQAGTLISQRDLEAREVSGSGAAEFLFDSVSGARQIVVTARLSTCRDTVKREGGTSCTFCDIAPGGSARPVAFADADMRYSDGEPLPPILGTTLGRTYDTLHRMAGLFGRGWMTLIDRRLAVTPRPEGELVDFTTETNDVIVFTFEGGAYVQRWPSNSNGTGTLTRDTGSGLYIHREAGAATQSLFRISDGRLAGIRQLATGRTLTIDYDGNGLPASVTDSWTGVKWLLSVDQANRRVTSISVEGRPDITWTYEYSGDLLMTVLAPGSTPWRTYEYENSRMTASRDAAGRLIESHTYDANGAATSSTGEGEEISLFEYNLPHPAGRITRVTTRSGAVTGYVLAPVGGAWRTVQVIGGCSSCDGRDSSYVYDADGHTVRHENASGYVTLRTYTDRRLAAIQEHLRPSGCDPESDASRCRLDSAALAAATFTPTAATVTTTYTYGDANWPDKPTTIAIGTRRETFTYDAVTGEVVQRQTIGWTGEPLVEQTRTTVQAFYNGTEGAAFTPGGSFSASWLSLPQPVHVLKSVDGPRSDAADITRYVYYPLHTSVPAALSGRLAAVRDAAGHITRIESYDVFGNATRTVDPNGVATETTFDALGRMSATTVKGISGCDTTTDPLCATDLATTRTYSAAGPLDHEQRAGGGVTSYTYDSRGRVVSLARGISPTDLRERIETTYSPTSGRKALEVYFAKEGAGWIEKKRESFTYDTLDELSAITHADNTSVGYSYRDDGKLAGVRDENHATPNTSYDYDPAGRMAKVTQKLGAGFAITRYAYDIHGNLTSVTDPNGNVTSYVYDDFGQMLKQISPVTGVTTYEYDPAGNLTRTLDANGAATTRTYDALGRVLSALSSRPERIDEGAGWTYDDDTPGAFGIGRVASMLDPMGSASYRYDRRGLLVSEDRTIMDLASGEICPDCIREYVTQYRYDADGNRAAVIYPSGRAIDYTYDYAGRPTSATAVVTSATYLPFGPLKTLSYGNGTTQTWTFDARYRPVTNQVTAGAATLASYSYGHDAAGNITAITDAQDAAYNRTFGYDDLSRLVTANTGGSLWGTGSFVYDAMGNMLSRSRGTLVTTFAYQGTTPKLTSSATTGLPPETVTYDAAGNETTSKYGRTFSPRNLMSMRLGPVTAQKDGYDARGVRVMSATQDRRTGGADAPFITAHYQYSPELNLLSTSTDVHQTEIVWFAGRPVAQFDTDEQSTTLRYTATDHLGTPFLQTDPSAQPVWRAEYDPYGTIAQMRTGTEATQPLRFPGQEAPLDGAESYNIFRWYRAEWGRYAQGDPIRPAYPSTSKMADGALDHNSRPEISSKVEPYVYAGNSPINSIDPLGLARCIFLPVNAFADYQQSGPPGATFKGCIYIGGCGGVTGDRISGGIAILFKYVKPGCRCPLWCTYTADDRTGRQISPTRCFDIPLPWAPPLIR